MDDSHQPCGGKVVDFRVSEPCVEQSGARLINLFEQLQFSGQGPQVRLLLESQEARLVGFALRAGQEIKKHRSPSQVLVQVITGSLTFTVADQPFSLRTGMVLQVNAGIPHHLRATADTLMLLIMTPSPVRLHTESRA